MSTQHTPPELAAGLREHMGRITAALATAEGES